MRVFAFLLAMVLGAAGQEVQWPELRGIIHLGGDNQPAAVLVFPQTNLNSRFRTAPGPRYASIVRVGQNDPGLEFGYIEVTHIDAAARTVKLRHRARSRVTELKLTGAPSGEKYLVHLERAPLHIALQCYQQLARRTVVHSPRLPHAELDLHIPAGTELTKAVTSIARSLQPHQIVLATHGEKFAFAVPPEETNHVATFAAAPQVKPADQHTVFAPALIKFVAADGLQVIDFYSDLCGRTVLRPNHLPASPVTLQSETSLTREEAVWLIESALRLGGLATIPAGEKFVYVVPRKRSLDLPVLELKRDLPGAAGVIKFVDVDRERLLESYAAMTGRKPLPVEPNVPHAKFSLRSHAPLTPGEAAFAFEALAILNGLALQDRPENKVALVPRALANLQTN